MLEKSRLLAAAIGAIAVFAIGAAPASAQGQQGLVNVAVEDVTVQVPASVAANVCDVNVGVLAEMVDQGSGCVATADSAASRGQSSPNGPPTRQDGLVNVLLDDVVVQVPVAVAANICDVNVAVLADVLDDGTACQAVAASEAQPGGGGGGAGANAAAFDPVQIVPDIGLRLLDNDAGTTTGIPLVS